MPDENLTASASLEILARVMFPQNVCNVLREQLDDYISTAQAGTFGLRIQRRELGNETSGLKGIECILRGTDARIIAQTYAKLAGLLKGSVVLFAPQDRGKIFPSKKEEAACARVGKFFADVSKKHKCLVRPKFTDGLIEVIGPQEGREAVARELADFARQCAFEASVRVPPRFAAGIKVAMKMVPGATVDFDFQFPSGARGVRLTAKEAPAFAAARSELSDAMQAAGARINACSVCFEHTELSLQTCGHFLCEDCGPQHVATSVFDNMIPLTDPACRTVLLHEDIATHAENVDAVYNAGVRVFMLEHPDTLAHCHTPDCPMILDKTLEATTCCVCFREQCPLCGAAPHPAESCEDAEKRRSFEMSLEGQVAQHVKKIREHMTVPTCPGCGVAFLDFSGCFAITCHLCRTGFCGFCLHNCGKQDPHIHSANCPFYGKHFVGQSHHGLGMSQENLFSRSMRIRLPELVLEYISKLGEPLSQLVLRACKDLPSTAFFDASRL
ncbi:unnamed protein product [Effrenium voratum]|nr:unnamed protein product [Effrenium voratum]